MADTLQSVLIGGAAGLVSAVITHFSTRAKIRLDLAAAYDKELQESRLATYKELWAMLEPLARYAGPKVTFALLAELGDKTRKWYFQQGGIYLTERSRGPYFKMKELMQPWLDAPECKTEREREIDRRQLEPVIAAASKLRTALSDDIGTKRLSRL